MPCTCFPPTEGPPSGEEGGCRGRSPGRGCSPGRGLSCFSGCGWRGPRHCRHLGGGHGSGALATSLHSDLGTSGLRIAPPPFFCGLEKVTSLFLPLFSLRGWGVTPDLPTSPVLPSPQQVRDDGAPRPTPIPSGGERLKAQSAYQKSQAMKSGVFRKTVSLRSSRRKEV